MKKFKNREHTVDEENKIVTVSAHNLSSALCASKWVEKYFPGYQARVVTKRLNKS